MWCRHCCAPNFALPIYPGGFYDKEADGLEPYPKATKDTSPLFFAMAQDDRVNCLNCTALFTALKQEKVPAELHLFTRGGHGDGLHTVEVLGENLLRLRHVVAIAGDLVIRCLDKIGVHHARLEVDGGEDSVAKPSLPANSRTVP